MTKDWIPLSEKYGVNPAVSICFWCRKDKNEVILFGRLKGDAEAPRNPVMDYEPCDDCASMWNQGIRFIECSSVEMDDRPPIQEGAWPTGAWCVLKEEAVRRQLEGAKILDSFLEHRGAFIDSGTWDLMGLPRESLNGTNE